MSIEKGRPFEQSPKMKGIFYEAMQEKKLSESPKPLILLGFSKSSVSPLAPLKTPDFFGNRVFFFVFWRKNRVFHWEVNGNRPFFLGGKWAARTKIFLKNRSQTGRRAVVKPQTPPKSLQTPARNHVQISNARTAQFTGAGERIMHLDRIIRFLAYF